jgi:hypothetical protein
MRDRVVLVVNSLGRGGAERQAALIAEGLLDRGAEVHVLSVLDRFDYASESVREVTTVLGKRSTLDTFGLAMRVRRELNSHDIVLCFNYYPSVLAWLSGRRSRRVVRYGNAPAFDGVRGLQRVLARLAQRSSVASVGCSQGVSRAAAEQLGSPNGFCSWVLNAAAPVAASSESPYPKPYVVAAGRLQEQKDYPTMIRAFAATASSVPHDLVIAGDGPLLAALQDQVRDAGLDERVKFVGYQSNLGDWLAHADLMLLTSRWEGFGSVIVEAMAVGTPVVCTDVPFGPAEIVSRVPGGVLVPAEDSATISAAVTSLLLDPSERARLSEIARRGVAREFSVDRMQGAYWRLLNDVESL